MAPGDIRLVSSAIVSQRASKRSSFLTSLALYSPVDRKNPMIFDRLNASLSALFRVMRRSAEIRTQPPSLFKASMSSRSVTSGANRSRRAITSCSPSKNAARARAILGERLLSSRTFTLPADTVRNLPRRSPQTPQFRIVELLLSGTLRRQPPEPV